MRCRCKYRVRWFYSKGAFLTLVWCLLVSMIATTEARFFYQLVNLHQFPDWIGLIPGIIAVLVLMISGWLADKKFGNYKVAIARFGLIILFLGTSSVTIYTLFLGFLSENRYLAAISFCIVSSMIIVGLTCFGITSLQLGLDQMPDASSSNITSFVAWYVFTFTVGFWIGDYNNVNQIWSLYPSLCATVTVYLELHILDS